MGFAIRTPDFGFIAKIFFDPKPAKRLDIASAETARVPMTMLTQSA
jgi:hypothetical protein